MFGVHLYATQQTMLVSESFDVWNARWRSQIYKNSVSTKKAVDEAMNWALRLAQNLQFPEDL